MRKYRESIWTNLWKGLFLSSLIGMFNILIIIILFSAFVYFLTDNCDNLSAFTRISLIIGTFISGLFCGHFRRRKGIIEGAACGILIYMVILTFGIFINGSLLMSFSIKKLLLSAVFGGIGGVCGVNTKHSKKPY